MPRVAIYARYSSDLQSDASIEDQIRLCQERIDKEGWFLKTAFKDHGLSGATMLRPGIQELIGSALKGEFDGLLPRPRSSPSSQVCILNRSTWAKDSRHLDDAEQKTIL